MKKLILFLAFAACLFEGSAQNVVYDYVIVEYSPFARRIEIEMFPSPMEVFLLKDLVGKENDRDRAFFIAKIRSLEEQGWELFEAQLATPGEMSSSMFYVWTLRKPKQ
ncbi:MAG: hypothetical protein IPM46_06640 [Flavobacteriales bacterium]|nr:hypothetical protein [Flavobacteriales bacterium]